MITAAPSPERINQLVTDLRDTLAAHGFAEQHGEEPGMPADVWRKAARRAGRELGRPVRTFTVGQIVTAALTDWPANDAEKRVRAARMRAAMNAVTPLGER